MMDDFGLSEEQRAIQALARKFASEYIKPIAAKIDRMENVAENFPWDMLKQAHKIGFKTLSLPKEYGGEEIDALTRVIICDELAFADSTCCKIISQCWSTVLSIVRHGTKEQHDRFLTAYRDDPTCLICVAKTEPDYGSDNQIPYEGPEGGLKLSVKRKGEGYVLNGNKHFNSLGGVAKLFVVSGRTDTTVPVSQGSSLFVVPKDTPGFSVTRVEGKVGWRAYQNADLTFEDVYVPKENLLGRENMPTSEGKTSAYHLVELGANTIGLARAAYEAALDYAKHRVQGGKPIIEHQYVSKILSDMYCDLQAARSFVWHAAWDIDHGSVDQKLSIASSRFAGNVVQKVTQNAIAIFGGMGVMNELPIERYARDGLIAIVTAAMPARDVKLGNLLKK